MTFKEIGGITGAGVNFAFSGGTGPVTLMTISGNGSIVDSLGNFKAAVGTAGVGQYISGGGSQDGNCTGGCFVTGAGGTLVSTSRCLVQAANAGAVTITSPICTIESGPVNSATTFTITLPWAFSNILNIQCYVQDLTSGAFIAGDPCIATGTSTVTVSYLVAPASATNIFNIMIIGNGP
jgi:hypothetical protein